MGYDDQQYERELNERQNNEDKLLRAFQRDQDARAQEQPVYGIRQDEIEELQAIHSRTAAKCAALRADVTRLEAENTRYREALEAIRDTVPLDTDTAKRVVDRLSYAAHRALSATPKPVGQEGQS